jgi:sialate O-acetylesterase
MKSFVSSLVAGLMFVAGVSVGGAELKLAPPFGDCMVLQREMPVPIWGTAPPGAAVKVEFGRHTKTTKAGTNGHWQVKLGAMQASNRGQTLIVTSGNEKVTAKDVLVGEVWLCSGQSNMEMGISVVKDAKAEIAAADYPYIRLRYSNKVSSPKPETLIQGSEWMVCSPTTIVNGTWNGFSAAAYFFGRELQEQLKVPVGLIQSSWGGTRIEPWTPPAGDLYNAMIHPWAGFAIRGSIWYQGESNMGEGMAYAGKMKALIEGWRKAWGEGDFPFYYVQIAPFIYGNHAPYGLPEIWEAQAAALQIPNTGMAVINDIGELHDIHPKNKQDVGKRLALLALSRTYRQRISEDSGPLFKQLTIVGNKVRVEFTHANTGLKSRDGKPLTCFEVAGADGNFVPAESEIRGRTVLVHSPQVPTPKYVRFAWRQDAEPNLMNNAGLPASAFCVAPRNLSLIVPTPVPL